MVFDLEPEELIDVLEQIKRGKRITDESKTRMAKSNLRLVVSIAKDIQIEVYHS